MMTMADLYETFGDYGVTHVIEEQWLDPGDIPDQELRKLYRKAVRALEEYQTAREEFQALLDDKESQEVR